MAELGYELRKQNRRGGKKVTTGQKNVKTPTKLKGGTEKGNVVRDAGRGRTQRQKVGTGNKVTSNQQQGPNRFTKVTRTGGETVKSRIGQKVNTYTKDMLNKIRMLEDRYYGGNRGGQISSNKGGTDANYTGSRKTGPNRVTGGSRIGRLISGSKGGDSSPKHSYKLKPDSGGAAKAISTAASLARLIRTGSILGYILNDITNPPPLADGTLDAAKERGDLK